MPRLDKESQVDKVIQGLQEMLSNPSGRAYNQLSGLLTDPTMDALPMMGFRVPGAIGRQGAQAAQQLMKDINVAREAIGERPTVFGRSIPRMPFMSAPEVEGGRATSPFVDQMYGAAKPGGLTDEMLAELSNIRLRKNIQRQGYQRLVDDATVKILNQMRDSLGSRWTKFQPPY